MADDITLSDLPSAEGIDNSLPLPRFYLDAIKKFEGFAPTAGWDYKQWTNGYGTRAKFAGETIDRAEADRRFNTEIGKAADVVNGIAPDAPMGVKAALTSLTYNAGGAWTNGGLGEAVKRHDWPAAAERLQQYDKAGGKVLPALVKRREAESGWFSNPEQMAAPPSIPHEAMQSETVEPTPTPGVTQTGDSDFSFGGPLSAKDLVAPPPPPSESEVLQRNYQMSLREKQAGWYEPLAAAYHDTVLGHITDAVTAPNFSPDPNFNITQENLDAARKAGVTDEYIPSLGHAVSQGNFDQLVQDALTDQNRRKTIADAGWYGTAAEIGLNLLDPVAWTAGIATGGLADIGIAAAEGGNVARILGQGAAGAIANVGLEKGTAALSNRTEEDHTLRSAALGALFGLGFGAISRNPYVTNEVAGMQKALTGLERTEALGLDNLKGSTGLSTPGSSVGAMVNPHVNMPYLDDKEWSALAGADAPDSAFSKLRWSSVNQLKKSENPGVRLMSILGHDAVGGTKDSKFFVNPISAEEEQKRFYRSWHNSFENTYNAQFKEWADDVGLKWYNRASHWEEFGEQVDDYVRGINEPDGGWHKNVKTAGDKIRAQNSDVLANAKNPLLRDGLQGRPIAGFEEVPENPFYMSRIHSASKWNRTIADYSEKGAMSWWEGAIRSGHAAANVEIEDDLVRAMARGTVRNSYIRSNEINDNLNNVLAGKDFDGLAAMLREEGVGEDRITQFLDRWKNRPGPGATDVRAKPRVLIDEGYQLPYPKTTGGEGTMSLKDFIHTDAHFVQQKYLRHMSGRVALGRVRIKNPETGNMLVDGITSDKEFSQVMSKLNKLRGDLGPTKDQGNTHESEKQTIKWLYDHVLGRVDPQQRTKFAIASRLFRKANFIRVFGQVAFSQMQDFSSGVAQLGLRAMLAHMPALRRIIDMKGEEILANGLDHVLESQMGISSDVMRGVMHFRDQEAPLDGILGKVDNALEWGQHMVSKLSGMEFVNNALTRMSAKAVVQNFADIARNPTKANMQRMMSLGLDEAMVKRISAEVKANFKTKDKLFFKGTVTDMNLAGWKDREARAAFENAVFRWTRRVVQENDYGSMARWMSHPAAQLMTQFRTFTFSAWEKQFLHNLKMGDSTTFHMFWMSMALAAATYAARTQLRAMGRSDREDYLKKQLSIPNIAGAAFQMAGWSSILPMVIDTAVAPFHDPLFDYRSTEQATNLFTGNPTGDFINTLMQASRATTKSLVEHRPMTQSELRKWQRLTPLGTWYPMVPLFNYMISGHPTSSR